MKDKVRVASGQGFWGDLLTAPVDQVRGGPIDYLMLDYLAEVTMSIMQKQRARDPQAGEYRIQQYDAAGSAQPEPSGSSAKRLVHVDRSTVRRG